MNSEVIKKLIKIVVFTLTISYFLDKLVFFSLNKISDKVMTGQAIGKLNQFLTVKDNKDVLVFGNSRANHHINVDLYSENGYNIGVDGVGIAYSSALINTLNKNKKQVIIVHIDTKNFFNASYNGSDILGLKTKYNRDNNITKSLDKSNRLSILQKFYYSMNYNGNTIGILKNYFKPSYNHITYNGYDPLIVSESQVKTRDIILSKAKDIENCKDMIAMNETAIAYLKTIKSFIEKSQNKTFIFVTSPIYNDSCDEDNIKFANLMKELNLAYWDFSNLYKDTNNKSYWKDATHMSNIGALEFSKHLFKKLN